MTTFEGDLREIMKNLQKFRQIHQKEVDEKIEGHLANSFNSLDHIIRKHNPNVKVKLT